MKLRFVFPLLALMTSVQAAQVKIQEELFIPGTNPEVVRDLIETGTVVIDHVSSEGFELYGPSGIAQYLDQKNIVYLDMKEINNKAFADYPSSKQIEDQLHALAQKYPKIMRLESVGKSNKGKDLWVMKISDNPEMDEVEPEFKYISSMHGDEITGRELMMTLIEEMGSKYGSDPIITELINNTEIYIMPSMNPDGSDMKQRANAKWTDLNRNFPDMTRDTESSPNGRQIETQHIMKFQSERQFALSANFHGGAVVANYPWDSKYDVHPLNDLVIELSQGYANLNPAMRNSREFHGGITNGAQWYIVRGGMQDWSYVWHNDLQITVELSDRKWPSYSEIPSFYRDNRDSLIYFMSEIHRGAGFKFTRSGVSGTVAIKQTGSAARDLGSYAFRGSEFYKVLPEGDYQFSIKENGSQSVRVYNVRVDKNTIHPNGNYLTIF